jgi:hypothetical protein
MFILLGGGNIDAALLIVKIKTSIINKRMAHILRSMFKKNKDSFDRLLRNVFDDSDMNYNIIMYYYIKLIFKLNKIIF